MLSSRRQSIAFFSLQRAFRKNDAVLLLHNHKLFSKTSVKKPYFAPHYLEKPFTTTRSIRLPSSRPYISSAQERRAKKEDCRKVRRKEGKFPPFHFLSTDNSIYSHSAQQLTCAHFGLLVKMQSLKNSQVWAKPGTTCFKMHECVVGTLKDTNLTPCKKMLQRKKGVRKS